MSVFARPAGSRRRAALAVVGLAGAAVLAAGCLPPEEQTFLDRTNELRAAAGLAVLSDHEVLNEKAEAWAAHLAETGQLDHSSLPSSLDGLQWSKLAENVGMSEPVTDTLLAIHDEFATSGAHLDNLLDPAFDHMGVGVAEGADGRVWVVEVFADLP